MKHFVNLQPGYIVSSRDLRRVSIGAVIHNMLGSWANHDALVIRDRYGDFYIGDMQPLRGRLTSLADYEYAVEIGQIDIRIYKPFDYSEFDGQYASAWWEAHEVGKIYNFLAYPKLFAKAIFGDSFQWSTDLEWDWCSEGAMDAWLAAGKDYWRKAGDTTPKIRPTPLTLEHRAAEGIFLNITNECFV